MYIYIPTHTLLFKTCFVRLPSPKPFDTVMLCPDANDNWGPLRNGVQHSAYTFEVMPYRALMISGMR